MLYDKIVKMFTKEKMKLIIGIDIDDTLTNLSKKLHKAALKYAKSLNKKIDKSMPLLDVNNDGNVYKKKFNFTYDELHYFLSVIQEDLMKSISPRNGVVKVLKKLREDGHKIIIITARDTEFHEDPYKLSEEWLKKNNITYDKLVVNEREKAPACLRENIDLFIDDALHNCVNIKNAGIRTIKIGKTKSKEVICFKNWFQIYKYIKKLD